MTIHAFWVALGNTWLEILGFCVAWSIVRPLANAAAKLVRRKKVG